MQSRYISNIPKFAVGLTVSFMLAFMPFTVNLNEYRITLERNEAHAIAPVFVGALAFLEEAAAAAGFATVGEFVATGAGITAVASGLTIGTAAGMQLGDNAGNNLDALVDAADYPSWDTLSSTEQESWGSEDNYNAAKYNSLMASFGLGDDYERYKSTWGTFTPGEFQFSSSANDKLEQIGEIGENWVNGAGNSISSILGLNFNKNEFNQWLPPEQFTYTADPNDSEWPAYLSTTLNYTQATEFGIQYAYNGNPRYRTWITSSPVYCFAGYAPNVTNSQFGVQYFSLNDFYSGMSTTQNPTDSMPDHANSINVDGTNVYLLTYDWNYPLTNSTIPVNSDISYLIRQTNENRARIYLKMLNGGVSDSIPQMTGYPSDEIANETYDQNTIIYFPITGITDTTKWSDFTQSDSGNPDNPDNPDNPGNTVDLSGVIAILNHIDSDLHNMNIPGEPDLTPLITKLQTIDSHIQNLDFLTSSDLQNINSYIQHIDSDMHKFLFYQSGELKVHDEGVFTKLSDIYTLLLEISGKLDSRDDVVDAPDLIGDFDFDELEDKVPDLLETISDLAPFGSILLLSEMYTIMANYTQIDNPELVFPFDFGGFDDQNHELVIDLSWLDDIKPLINFFCIAMLIIAIANATIRIVEIEAAS